MWFQIQDQQVILNIYVKPNAKKTAIVKISDDELHIALHAKPHEGEANKELISYLAQIFKLPKSQVILHKGEASRHKRVIMPLTADVQRFLNDSVI
jgi:uncharacterized protein (TIGR00251 family)